MAPGRRPSPRGRPGAEGARGGGLLNPASSSEDRPRGYWVKVACGREVGCSRLAACCVPHWAWTLASTIARAQAPCPHPAADARPALSHGCAGGGLGGEPGPHCGRRVGQAAHPATSLLPRAPPAGPARLGERAALRGGPALPLHRQTAISVPPAGLSITHTAHPAQHREEARRAAVSPARAPGEEGAPCRWGHEIALLPQDSRVPGATHTHSRLAHTWAPVCTHSPSLSTRSHTALTQVCAHSPAAACASLAPPWAPPWIGQPPSCPEAWGDPACPPCTLCKGPSLGPSPVRPPGGVWGGRGPPLPLLPWNALTIAPGLVPTGCPRGAEPATEPVLGHRGQAAG